MIVQVHHIYWLLNLAVGFHSHCLTGLRYYIVVTGLSVVVTPWSVQLVGVTCAGDFGMGVFLPELSTGIITSWSVLFAGVTVLFDSAINVAGLRGLVGSIPSCWVAFSRVTLSSCVLFEMSSACAGTVPASVCAGLPSVGHVMVLCPVFFGATSMVFVSWGSTFTFVPMTTDFVCSIIFSKSLGLPFTSVFFCLAKAFLLIERSWAEALVEEGPEACDLIFFFRRFLGEGGLSTSKPSLSRA